MVTIRSAGSASAARARKQGGLAGVGAARDDHVEPGPHRGTQEPTQLIGDGVGQVVQGGVDQAVPPDGHARPVGHLDHGRQPVAAGQVQIDDGLGAVDPALAPGVVGPGRPLDQFDEVLVGVGDGVDLLLDPVGPLDPDMVGAIDVDVLDVVFVEQQLQPTETELAGHQPADDLFFFLGGRGGDRRLRPWSGPPRRWPRGPASRRKSGDRPRSCRRPRSGRCRRPRARRQLLELPALLVVHGPPPRSIRQVSPGQHDSPMPVGQERVFRRFVEAWSCVRGTTSSAGSELGWSTVGRVIAFDRRLAAVGARSSGRLIGRLRVGASMPRSRSRLGPLKQRGPLEPLGRCACWPTRRRPWIVGHGRPDLDLESAAISAAKGPRCRWGRSGVAGRGVRPAGQAEPPADGRSPRVWIAQDANASAGLSTSRAPPARFGRSRPTSTTTSASRAPSASATTGQALSLAVACCTPGNRRARGDPRGDGRRGPRRPRGRACAWPRRRARGDRR